MFNLEIKLQCEYGIDIYNETKNLFVQLKVYYLNHILIYKKMHNITLSALHLGNDDCNLENF